MKFRKKPVVIEAWQFKKEFVESFNAIEENIKMINEHGIVKTSESPTGWAMFTLEDIKKPHEVTPDDWIITGVKGEKYPCKPEIFAMTYEPEHPMYSVNADGKLEKVKEG